MARPPLPPLPPRVCCFLALSAIQPWPSAEVAQASQSSSSSGTLPCSASSSSVALGCFFFFFCCCCCLAEWALGFTTFFVRSCAPSIAMVVTILTNSKSCFAPAAPALAALISAETPAMSLMHCSILTSFLAWLTGSPNCASSVQSCSKPISHSRSVALLVHPGYVSNCCSACWVLE